MANYFRRLTSNIDLREGVALALISIVLLKLAYLVTVFAISHMPAPFGSVDTQLHDSLKKTEILPAQTVHEFCSSCCGRGLADLSHNRGTSDGPS